MRTWKNFNISLGCFNGAFHFAPFFRIFNFNLQILILVIIAVVISCILIIFPIFLNVNLIFNYEHKKAYFLLEIFGFIKILSGYIQLSKNILYIHVSDTKAIIFEFIDLDGVKKSFKPFMDYHFISFKCRVELGLEDNQIIPFATCFLLRYIQSIIRFCIINKKPYITFKNYFDVYDKDKLIIYLKTLITLNLLMIIISVIKILTEKLIYEFRKITQQN